VEVIPVETRKRR